MAAPTLSHPAAENTGDAALPVVPWDRVDRFVGQLTHDIRNGLNALELQLTFLGEISTDPEAADEIKRVRATLGNVTRQLQALRIATATVRPYPLAYPTTEFFDDLRERFVKSHPESAGRIVWGVGPDAESMLGVDPELTINALLELLANALTFADDARSQIRVVVSATGEGTRFTLLEPRGAKPEVTPQDWGRTPLLTTHRGSYGLGLFRVRRSLEAQNGTLEVDYSEENHLLTTQVLLPAAAQN